jgi:hypothetical protein
MTKILQRIEGHYEVHEGPFSKAYVWHPAYVTLQRRSKSLTRGRS